MINKFVNSVAGKLIIAVGAIMVTGSLLFGFIFIRYEEDVMMNNLIQYASATADIIKRNIQYGMLTDHREVIEHTTKLFGESSGIKDVTIYSKTGKIVYSSKKDAVGHSVDKGHASCQICHKENKNPLSAIKSSQDCLITTDAQGIRTLTSVIPLFNEPSCASGACHYHPQNKKILGILETKFSTTTVDSIIQQNRFTLALFSGIFLVIISFSIFAILYKLVSKPISLLNEGMQQLTTQKEHVITVQSNDEIGMLAKVFNSMAAEIRQYREKMEDSKKSLEEQIQRKTAEIIKARDQLINAEKLASLGRLAAGVANELSGPLENIEASAQLMLKRCPPEGTQEMYLRVIMEQASRSSEIIKDLLSFSRKITAEKIAVSINQLAASAISMISNKASFYNIQFSLDLDKSVPLVALEPDHIQQVFLNILINAVDAIKENGRISVSTRVLDEAGTNLKSVEIEFADTGPGIPKEDLNRIFEPFFTTKTGDKGTGLGLSVSYGIIKKHGGLILVTSEPGKGSSFLVRIPIQPQ